MGGHGGLNILPQKKWNVYNYDNRDIVQKDKKEHAQKMQKSYECERKHTMQRKFEVLKGEHSIQQKKQQKIKQSYKADSILNHQFKRLAQENQHVNLFQHQQKIIQNRQVLEYHKMKQAQWLKGKDLDYSSKFLGTYNDDGKTPWYAKSKGASVAGRNKKGENVHNKRGRQRYDMEDLTDVARLEKLASRKQYYLQEMVKQNGNVQKQTIIQQKRVGFMVKKQQISGKVKRETFSDQRQRSRHRKFEFMKQRESLEQIGSKRGQSTAYQTNNTNNSKTTYPVQSNQQELQGKESLQQQINDHSITVQHQHTGQLQLLRLKRLKRQQKQRRKAQQLRKKLQQSINRN